jgi:hypothetical protein
MEQLLQAAAENGTPSQVPQRFGCETAATVGF